MEEIEFRVWDTDGQEMLDLLALRDETGNVLMQRMTQPKTIIRNRPGHVEILQYTGLKDKKGKKIFKGDILLVDWQDSRYPVHTIGPVAWDMEEARWSLGEGGWAKHDAECYMEVIGNRYEHPELLNSV